jgi:hypothetical protein
MFHEAVFPKKEDNNNTSPRKHSSNFVGGGSGNTKSTPCGKFKVQSNNIYITEMCHDSVFQKLK